MENVRQAGLLVKSLAGVLQSTVQYELLRSRTQESQVGVIAHSYKGVTVTGRSYCAFLQRSHGCRPLVYSGVTGRSYCAFVQRSQSCRPLVYSGVTGRSYCAFVQRSQSCRPLVYSGVTGRSYCSFVQRSTVQRSCRLLVYFEESQLGVIGICTKESQLQAVCLLRSQR